MAREFGAENPTIAFVIEPTPSIGYGMQSKEHQPFDFMHHNRQIAPWSGLARALEEAGVSYFVAESDQFNPATGRFGGSQQHGIIRTFHGESIPNEPSGSADFFYDGRSGGSVIDWVGKGPAPLINPATKAFFTDSEAVSDVIDTKLFREPDDEEPVSDVVRVVLPGILSDSSLPAAAARLNDYSARSRQPVTYGQPVAPENLPADTIKLIREVQEQIEGTTYKTTADNNYVELPVSLDGLVHTMTVGREPSSGAVLLDIGQNRTSLFGRLNPGLRRGASRLVRAWDQAEAALISQRLHNPEAAGNPWGDIIRRHTTGTVPSPIDESIARSEAERLAYYKSLPIHMRH